MMKVFIFFETTTFQQSQCRARKLSFKEEDDSAVAGAISTLWNMLDWIQPESGTGAKLRPYRLSPPHVLQMPDIFPPD